MEFLFQQVEREFLGRPILFHADAFQPFGYQRKRRFQIQLPHRIVPFKNDDGNFGT